MVQPQQRYKVVKRIQAGGMAEVFLGTATSVEGFKKKVAIKRVLPHLAQNKQFIKMFLDEARLGARLNHANIVTVFDIGAAESTYFIVMEYVDGANLKTILETLRKNGQQLTPKEALFIIMECCRGLSYAHELADDDDVPLNLVHRDISPPNILITKRGEIKVTDFGLAKATTQLEKTDPGVVKGKFSYLSPEAASAKQVDAKADIFALGIILWEMLAGKRLFTGESDYQTVKLVQRAEIPSLQALNPEVDAELEQIVRKALARNPEERYPTARELGDSIAGYLFSRQLKVTSYDIANLVSSIVEQQTQGIEKPSMIDQLIQEELLRFTSIEEVSDALHIGAQPLSPDDVVQNQPLNPLDFENPADWFTHDRDVQGSFDRLEQASAVVQAKMTETDSGLAYLEEDPLAEEIAAGKAATAPSSPNVGLWVVLFVALGLAAGAVVWFIQ